MEIDFNNLFNDENIEFVSDKMKYFLPKLFTQEKSIENMNEIFKVYDKIYNYNNKEILDIFIHYSNLKYESSKYENWLAYCIGFTYGFGVGIKTKD